MTRDCALLACLLGALLAPLSAPAAIYKWVDENGSTIYSNQPPPKSLLGKAKVVVPDEPVGAASEESARRERELLERVSRLERELAARPSVPPIQYTPPVQYAPPPAPIDYYGNGYGYAMPYYYYPPVYPAAVIVRPVSRFAVRSFRPGTMHHFRRR